MYKLTFTDEFGHIPDDKHRVMFNVNRKKNKIACIAHVMVKNFHDYFDADNEWTNWDINRYILKRLKDYNIINKKAHNLEETVIQVVGIAQCDPSDEFDEAYGKHIAETRARRKVYEIMKYINKFVTEYINMLSFKLSISVEKTNFLLAREAQHELYLVKNEDNKAFG